MKLLRSEAEFFAWMRTQWDEPDDETGMRAIFGVPNQYPCYVFWRAVPEDDPELGVLYEADVSDMLTVLHRAKNEFHALVALLDSPFTYVDDTTPEQESTP